MELYNAQITQRKDENFDRTMVDMYKVCERLPASELELCHRSRRCHK